MLQTPFAWARQPELDVVGNSYDNALTNTIKSLQPHSWLPTEAIAAAAEHPWNCY